MENTNNNWKPSKYEMEWLETLLRTIKVGGYWIIPINKSKWKLVDRDKKIMKFVEGDIENGLSQMTLKTFKAIGWRVEK